MNYLACHVNAYSHIVYIDTADDSQKYKNQQVYTSSLMIRIENKSDYQISIPLDHQQNIILPFLPRIYAFE